MQRVVFGIALTMMTMVGKGMRPSKSLLFQRR